MAGSAALARAFDADLAFFNECGIREGGWAVVEAASAQEDHGMVAAAVADMGADHPGVASYLMDPLDVSPRRASDAIERVRERSRGPLAPHRILGVEHQLSMLVALSPDVGRGWVVMRSGRGFTDDQVTTAGNVLSLLTALDRPHPVARSDPATVRKHLERVYAKLDCHDRLLPVERGRALGLIPV